ncbi:MAG: hypothetical protein ABMA64_37175, partial [Myxococcota bacterium]
AGRGDRQGAIRWLDRELSVRPAAPDAVGARCGYLREDRRPDRMDELARAALALSPDDPTAWACRAAAALDRGDLPAARAAVDRALGVAPDHPLARSVAAALAGATGGGPG